MRCSLFALCLVAFVAAASAICPTGEETDFFAANAPCVPVSCASARACASDSTCQAASVQCKRAPCPQFTCVPRPVCPAGFEVDSLTNVCVAVSCTAQPCATGRLCLTTAVQCIRAPCPQFTCVAPKKCGKGFELDTSTNVCVAVNCAAKPCPSGVAKCVTQVVQCVRAPCPQYTCSCIKSNSTYDATTRKCASCPVFKCAAVDTCNGPITRPDFLPGCPGCPVCSACAANYEWDTFASVCTPVNCAAPGACPSGKKCAPATLNCFRAPCPQFTCS